MAPITPMIAGALISGASQFGNSFISGGLGLYGQKKQFEYNKQLVQQQNAGQLALQQDAYQKNLEQWNRENEYNAPKAQMARLQEAGLNPNLIYGSTDGGTAARSPQYEPPQLQRAEAPNYGALGLSMNNILPDAIQAVMASANLSNQLAQTEYTKALTQKALAESDKLGKFNMYADELYSSNAANSTMRLATNKLIQQMYTQQIGLNDKKAELLQKQIDTAYWEYERSKQSYDFDVATYETRRMAVSLAVVEASARIKKLQADTALSETRNDMTRAQTISYYEGLKKIKADTLNSLLNAFRTEQNPRGYSSVLGDLYRFVDQIIDTTSKTISGDSNSSAESLLKQFGYDGNIY